MKFTDWLWTNKTTEEIRREAFQPTDESRECDLTVDARLGAERQQHAESACHQGLEKVTEWGAALEASCGALAEVHQPPRPTARVFLMPLKFDRLTEAVAYLSVRGWRMKIRSKYVEMIL